MDVGRSTVAKAGRTSKGYRQSVEIPSIQYIQFGSGRMLVQARELDISIAHPGRAVATYFPATFQNKGRRPLTKDAPNTLFERCRVADELVIEVQDSDFGNIGVTTSGTRFRDIVADSC